MITRRVVAEIQRLLRDKRYSQRKIALKLGVSRGTVNAIATGKRQERYVRAREEFEDAGLIFPSGVPRRCPICGAKVLMPCLACQVRESLRFRNSSYRKDNSVASVAEKVST